MNAEDSSGNNYVLVDASISSKLLGGVNPNGGASDPPYTASTGGGGSGGSASTVFDLDFDMSTLQIPRTLRGDAYVRFTLTNDTASAHNAVIATARLRKWTGTAESTIVSVSSASNGLGANEFFTYTLKLTVPSTNFKKGETIRITIEVTSESNVDLLLAHNPKDSAIAYPTVLDLDAGNTRLAVALPFRIET